MATQSRTYVVAVVQEVQRDGGRRYRLRVSARVVPDPGQPAKDGFDDLVLLAAHIADAPIALVSFLEAGARGFV